MLKNKLISDERRLGYQISTGRAFPEERQSGRTTAKCIENIGKAMKSPGEWIIVMDFFEIDEPYVLSRNRDALEKCMFLVHKLDLKYFEFDKTTSPPRMRYNVFEEVEDVSEPVFPEVIALEKDGIKVTYEIKSRERL